MWRAPRWSTPFSVNRHDREQLRPKLTVTSIAVRGANALQVAGLQRILALKSVITTSTVAGGEGRLSPKRGEGDAVGAANVCASVTS